MKTVAISVVDVRYYASCIGCDWERTSGMASEQGALHDAAYRHTERTGHVTHASQVGPGARFSPDDTPAYDGRAIGTRHGVTWLAGTREQP